MTPGTRLGPYELIAVVGAGGMGEVYRARDTRLGRDVAIKILPAAFASDPDRHHRFEQEARAIAALNHPHICQLYDVGPNYLVMELVDGQPLRCPQPLNDALDLAIQIASALEEAHEKGVYHRDLKPDNILVTARGAKLLDFGVARFVAAETGPDVTRTTPGAIAGTPAYMSPEQAEGREMDARSDIFSFGAVLYEMLSGRRAFAEETTAQVLAAVLRDDPPPLPVSVLDTLVRRCLAKQPDDRFESMRSVRAALEQARSAGAARLEPRPSIAVLAFENLSSDPENEYFGDGMAEEIINALTRVPGLKVAARTSAFSFKRKQADVRVIAQTLGVAHILEGSVRKAGSRVRVTAQLIAASEGSHLWSARYDRGLADALQIQDEIAGAIAEALRVKLGVSPAGSSTTNADAHRLYLKGRYHWGKRTATALHTAIRYYRDAIEADRSYAQAHAGLAECYVPLAYYGHMQPREAWQKASAAALQALEIDPTLAAAETTLARARSLTHWDLSASEQRLRAAVDRDPEYSRARQNLAENLVATGRFDEARAQMQRALESDPLSLSINAAVALIAYLSRRYDDAIEQFQRTIELDPYFYPAHMFLGLTYEQTGAFDRAVEELERAAALSDNSQLVLASLGAVFTASGDPGRGRSILDDLQALAERRYVSASACAVLVSRLGDPEGAFQHLEQAFHDQCPWLLFAGVDPRLDGLRGDARFTDVIRRVGLV